MASMRLGVNTRDMSARCMSCAGGSSMRMFPGAIGISNLIASSTEPLPER